MNKMKDKTITITYTTLEPFTKEAQADEDDLLALIKERKIMGHCRNVKVTFTLWEC